MLVRAGNDGEWLQLRPVEGLPSGGFRSLCGADAANLLELDRPLPVAAFGPWPGGSLAGVDAVCLTEDGDIELLVGTWGEEPRDTLWRMLDVAGALRGTTLEAFASHLTELGGERSVTRWLHARVGGDATRLEARLREVLETGDFGFVLVTSNGAGDLAQPLQFVQQGGVRIRAFEVEVLRAGDVQAIEGIEVPLAGGVTSDAEPVRPAATAAPAWESAQPHLTVVPTVEPTHTPAAEPAQGWTTAEQAPAETASEPSIAPEPETAPDPEAEPGATEVETAPTPEAEFVALEPETAPEPEALTPELAAEELPAAPEDPSDVDTVLASVDRLDHRTSAHLRWLHDALLRLVDEAEYTTDGDRQFVTGWMHGTDRLPLYLLDSNGLLQLVIASLPEHEQREYADEVAGMLPETTGSVLLDAGYADIDVPGHLDDQTLLEYLVDNLIEALPGGREAFGTMPQPEGAEGDQADAELEASADAETDSEREPEASDADASSSDDDGGYGFALTTKPVPEPEAEASSEEGSDFFAGVSAGHDASDVASAVAGLGLAQDEQAADTTADADAGQQKSRWLRRRGAA